MSEGSSARLAAKLELAAPVYLASAGRLWSGPEVRAIYPVYLAMMHMVVRSTIPLLILARDHARARAGHDPICAALIGWWNREIQTELGADDALLDDLAATGGDPEIPFAAIPSPTVATLVGAQYYWVQHHHPVALLGLRSAIARFPPPPGFADRLAARTGLPLAAFETLRRHERLGPRRRAELDTLLDTLPLTRRHETLLGISALHSLDASVEVLTEIHDRVLTRR